MPGVVIEHEQQGTRAVFRPRDQEQVIGAEVKQLHMGGMKKRAGLLPPHRSAVVELPGGLLPNRVSTQRGACSEPVAILLPYGPSCLCEAVPHAFEARGV